jgi:hypothetical protein
MSSHPFLTWTCSTTGFQSDSPMLAARNAALTLCLHLWRRHHRHLLLSPASTLPATTKERKQTSYYKQSNTCNLRTTTGGALPIVLLLTHERDFREKLARVPLAKYFPKYRGGPDFQRATKYVVKYFRAVAYGHFLLPRVTAEMDVEEDIKFLLAAIIKTVHEPSEMSRALAESGFL